MSARKSISNSFTVNTIEDGRVFEIATSIDNIVIPSDSWSTTATLNVSLYKRDGTTAKTAYSNPYAVYYRTVGGQFFLVTSGTASTFSTNVSVSRAYGAVVVYMFSSAYSGDSPESQAYRAKKEVVILANGSTGARGKIGRYYYYAQEWSDSTTVSYAVTDTEAPYFYYNNNYWVFNPTTNGTYSMHDMGTPAESTTQNPTDWELMYNDFKFIISQAIFSDFAKLGSAVFNKDFMISQWGEKNGLQSADYQTANPYFFRTDTYTAFNGTMQVVGGDYNVNSRLKVSSFLAQTKAEGETNPRLYTITAKGSTTGGSLYVSVYKDGTNARFGFSSINTSRTEISYTVSVEANQYLSIEVYQTGSSSNVGTLTSITVQDGGFTTQGFIPNVAIDFFKGYIYAMQGFFKNVTVEGVLNNLVTVVDFTNNINTDLFIPINNSVSPYNIDEGRYTNWVSGNLQATYMFDPLCSGNMVNIKSLPATDTCFTLPWYLSNNTEHSGYIDYVRTSTKYNGTEHLITETELRQLVGKEITFYSDSIASETTNVNSLILPTISAQNSSYDADLLANDTMFVEPRYDSYVGDIVENRAYLIRIDGSVKVKFKSGIRKVGNNNFEVFYWAATKDQKAANTGWT